eukprot:TRINITY_DN39961_c0_g1_i1.p1 TRINITY_DN39961_c0_g1~~TRINITY_DN39961_c0_g1_i1.p1  ORF type:complete len:665 (-),score=88.38 TRINITY_DN39961_c0_g1_i1:80-2074(-)
MEVDWRDLNVKLGQRQILWPCSGQLRPGRMVALMGPSGSGKSTLLNCLRQNIRHGGEVRFDGARFAPHLRQLIGFVEQDDVVIPQLTVQESLNFLAELRFGLGSKEAADRVAEVIAALRLGRIAQSVIGEAGAGQRISGGERKRLCIAREVLGEPRLLLCDEPTSGLDSTMADQVISSMRRLCNTGDVSVLAAIHQPSSHIFAQFDDLVLLKEGRVFYCGPAAEAEALFSKYCHPRHPLQSTAEYLMDLLALETEIEENDAGMSGGKGFACGMPEDCQKEILRHARAAAAALPALMAASTSKVGKTRYAAPVMRQLALLTRRHWSLNSKEILSYLSLTQNIGLMLIAALLWAQLGFSESEIHPRWGVCIWTAGTWMFFPIFGGMATFPSFRKVLEKELSVGCYSLGAFYVARTLLVLPLEYSWPTLWTAGVFWITNINPNFWIYLQFQCMVYLSFAVFHGFGLAISASGMPPGRSNTFALLAITYFFAWSGFFADMGKLPAWISWLRHTNPFAYSLQLAMHIILPKDLEFTCDGSESTASHSPHLGEGCVRRAGDGQIVLTGEGARERHGVNSSPLLCLLVLICCLVLSRVLAYILLRYDLRASVDGIKGSVAAETAKNLEAESESVSVLVDKVSDTTKSTGECDAAPPVVTERTDDMKDLVEM